MREGQDQHAMRWRRWSERMCMCGIGGAWSSSLCLAVGHEGWVSMVEMSTGTCAWLWAKRGGEYRRDERGNLCLGLWAKRGGVSIVEMSVEVAWPASSDTLT